MKSQFTRVWVIDKKLFVADTIEDAILAYRAYYKDCYIEPTIIRAIGNGAVCCEDFDAVNAEFYLEERI